MSPEVTTPMGIFLDVIEAPDQEAGELARRVPREGSAETAFGSQLVVRDFQEILREAGINTHIRASRGRDIAAACGQLRHEQAKNC